jgi:hypothetical protein
MVASSTNFTLILFGKFPRINECHCNIQNFYDIRKDILSWYRSG